MGAGVRVTALMLRTRYFVLCTWKRRDTQPGDWFGAGTGGTRDGVPPSDSKVNSAAREFAPAATVARTSVCDHGSAPFLQKKVNNPTGGRGPARPGFRRNVAKGS